MQKQYIGKNRTENLEWLADGWLKKGPPVCFLQGFSGVGKTDLARDLRDLAAKRSGCEGAVIHEIADRPTPDVLESLMELSSILAQEGLPEMEEVLFKQSNPNLAYALETVLRRNVVVIVDEAQRFFHAVSGKPLSETDGILKFLGNRQNLPGRLLLLSDRAVEWSHGSEWIPKRTLQKLDPDEAIEALDIKLRESGVKAEIPSDRKQDLVRALDYNPRAIEALVGALHRDTLDDIIKGDPGLWAVRDREVSHEFIRDLEHRLLERTMRHLDEICRRRLWRLAVHRRNFKREVLERLCSSKDEVSALRAALESRFLINFYRGALSLNPIVREISLSHLREESSEFKQAHSAAADYHMRHFKAKQIVGSQAKLGESFAELRYHLVQAGRESKIDIIGQRFTEHLKKEISSVSPVPTDREELDERIGVLTVLLGNSGAKGLEYHLARCLQSRAKPGDIKQAAKRAARATGVGAPAASWYLRAELENQAEGLDAAMRTIYESIHKVPASDSLFSLIQLGSQLLAAAGRADEAVTLLREGIKAPGITSLSSLYGSCGEILARAGKTDEAVTLLREGIKVPGITSLSSLYGSCGEILARAGKTDEAVTLLREGIKEVPAQGNLFALYQSCGEILARAGKTDEAVTLLREGIKVPGITSLSSLYGSCGEILARAGKTDEAVTLLREGIKVPGITSLSSLYGSCGEILARAGKTDEAVTLLREGIKEVPAQGNLFALYGTMAVALCRAERVQDAITSQREALTKIPSALGGFRIAETALLLAAGIGDVSQLRAISTEIAATQNMKGQEALSVILEYELADNWTQAQQTAARSRVETPSYYALGVHESLCRLASGDTDGALKCLPIFPAESPKQGQTQWWLTTLICLRRGSRADATAALEGYLGRPVDEARELNEAFLLRLWDQQEVAAESSRLCFHFPIMPALLAGLSRSVHRVQFAKSVLPYPTPTTPAEIQQPSPLRASAPEIYVSYAWGEDSTDSGRQREEIVDRLCYAVAASGRAIGRDKNRMKGGDSIERFAQEISKAKRIVAVVSEKSLNSEFCMAHELFRSFRRCDFHRAEFQEKVIALVMDDAKPLLKDNFAVVALAKAWQDRTARLRAELQSVDPNRKSPALWLFVDMMEDMCPRLPDMLGALKDIVMKRGFEEIVKDGFNEVLLLLPLTTGK